MLVDYVRYINDNGNGKPLGRRSKDVCAVRSNHQGQAAAASSVTR
jgi:hypothetical protein